MGLRLFSKSLIFFPFEPITRSRAREPSAATTVVAASALLIVSLLVLQLLKLVPDLLPSLMQLTLEMHLKPLLFVSSALQGPTDLTYPHIPVWLLGGCWHIDISEASIWSPGFVAHPFVRVGTARLLAGENSLKVFLLGSVFLHLNHDGLRLLNVALFALLLCILDEEVYLLLQLVNSLHELAPLKLRELWLLWLADLTFLVKFTH